MNINKNAVYDVAGIGSALLDFTVEVGDEEIAEHGLEKGGMQLIEEDRSREILQWIEGRNMDITPGGSSANTIAGVANLDGKGLFYGMVGSDDHGDRYVNDTEKAGVISKISRSKTLTGHAITFITPDSERTFATHLGAALDLRKDNIDIDGIIKSKIIHMEGYLFEPPGLKEACLHAIEIARKNDVLVSLDLSDPGLIGRIHDTFTEVVRDHVDIVFVNEDEASAFTGKEKEDALDELYKTCPFAVVKLGAGGSIIKCDDTLYEIPVYKTDVVNTNGAGDMYAAGVLYGICRGLTPDRAGRIGSYASSLVVAQVGARVESKIDISAV